MDQDGVAAESMLLVPKSVCILGKFPIKQETKLRVTTEMKTRHQQHQFIAQAQQKRIRSLRRDKVDVYARLVAAVASLRDHEYEGGALVSRVERKIQCNTKHFRDYLQRLVAWGLLTIEFLQKKMIRRRLRSYRVIRVTHRGMKFLDLHEKLTELWQTVDQERYEALRVKQKPKTNGNNNIKKTALLSVSA